MCTSPVSRLHDGTTKRLVLSPSFLSPKTVRSASRRGFELYFEIPICLSARAALLPLKIDGPVFLVKREYVPCR